MPSCSATMTSKRGGRNAPDRARRSCAASSQPQPVRCFEPWPPSSGHAGRSRNPAFGRGRCRRGVRRRLAFHRGLDGYAPSPCTTSATGCSLKDESNRFGLPAFKVLGASWAVERALRADPAIHTLVAASAGNHGRAVAHVARVRGLRARVYLPARSVAARREAIAGEGAEVVVVDGTYEDAVRAGGRGRRASPACFELADVGAVRPGGVGDRRLRDAVRRALRDVRRRARARSASGRWAPPRRAGARRRASRWSGSSRDVAACLTAALATGRPVEIPTPGTAMAGLDCAVVSEAAWPSLRPGICGTVTVSDDEARAAMRDARRARPDDRGLRRRAVRRARRARRARARRARRC